jgi:chromosome segregation ATPase
MTELYEIKDALESARIDVQDCENAIDTAANEIDNVKSNVRDALDALEEFERDNDGRELDELQEKVLMLENRVYELTEKNGRLSDSLEDIGVIVADELTA